MILGQNSTFGSNFLSGIAIIVPELESFSSIRFENNINHSMTISQVYGNYQNITKEYIDNYNISNIPTWINDITYLLASFKNSVGAGNILGFNGDISEWAIYREDSIANKLEYIGSTHGADTDFIDYTALKNKTYVYYLYAKTENQISSGLESNYIGVNYYGYFLIDVDNDIIYTIDANVSGGEQTQNILYSEFESNQKYKSYNVGEMNYMSGNLSGIVMDARGQSIVPTNSIELLDKFQNFIKNNTTTKFLKTRKGEIFKIFTYDYSETPLEQGISIQPMVVSFSWSEIGKVGS